jgi:hypothetical protein
VRSFVPMDPEVLHRIARTVAPICILVALSLATAGSAVAARKNGIKPLAPKAGTSVPVGKSPKFRMKVSGPGQVWVHVCRSKKKDKSGVICSKESIGRAKKKNGVLVYKPTFYDYPGFWLNRPGRYYWQAFRIACNSQDCEQEGPIVRFRVK